MSEVLTLDYVIQLTIPTYKLWKDKKKNGTLVVSSLVKILALLHMVHSVESPPHCSSSSAFMKDPVDLDDELSTRFIWFEELLSLDTCLVSRDLVFN